MLRMVVVVLLLANALFLAWSLGAMDHLMDVRSTGDREPERQANQFNPSELVILPASAAKARTQSSRLECLEAGPFDPVEMAVVEQAAVALPGALTLTRRQAEFSGEWVVLSGPHANKQALDKKMEELRRAGVQFEEVTDNPGFKFSLVLGGRHPSAQEATAALSSLAVRGVTSATVAALKPPSTQWFLRRENADGAQAGQLRSIQGPRGAVVWVSCP